MGKYTENTPDLSYRTLFTALPESYIIFAANGPIYTIVDINPAQAKLTMTKPKDIIGKPMFEVFPDVSEKYLKTVISDMRDSFKRVVRTRKRHIMGIVRYDIKDPSGHFVERHWRTEHLPIVDDTGKVAFILQTSQDVTDDVKGQQRLKQIEHQLSDALSIGKVGSWQWDTKINKVTSNKTLADMFGLDPTEASQGIGFEAFMSVIHPDDRGRVSKSLKKSLQSNSRYNDEYRTFGSDGTIHWVIARGQPELTTTGEPTHMLGAVVDITERKQAEADALRQATFIETITRSIGEGVYATDKAGVTTFVNDAAQRALGYRSRELVGKNIHDLIHYRRQTSPKARKKQCVILKHVMSGKPYTDEDYFIGKDRNVFPVKYTSSPILGGDGSIEGSVVAFADITMQKRTEDTLRYQSLIVGSINDAIVTISSRSTITGWNSAATALFGFTEKEAIGKLSEEVLLTNTKHSRAKISALALTHGVWRGKLTCKHKSDEKIEVLASISSLKNADGEQIGLVAVLQNITEISRAQAEMAAAEIRAKISREQADKLKRQNEELVALNRTKDEFIALASHQLRTPATGVKQYLGMMLNGYSDPLSEGQQSFVERAYACNERQLRIVEDILRVAQVDLDKVVLHLQPTDITQVVTDIVETQQAMVAAHNQKLILKLSHPLVMANLDQDRFRMALDNIVDNASKYSHPNTTITISVVKHGNSSVEIRVADKGVGMRKAELPKLFQKFSRLENPLSVQVGGNGLGLYWSQKIIALHHGSINVSSKLGAGTTFSISLPLGKTS